MLAIFFLCLSLKSVTAPCVITTPLLTPTHIYTMREAKRNFDGTFAFVKDPAEIGQRFGRLVVISRIGTSKCGSIILRCRCDCGNYTDSWSTTLRDGTAQSCGCLNNEHRLAATTKHGKVRSRVYSSWCSMLSRCENENNAAFKDYGGRGITVCEQWHDFRNFLSDMGLPPEGMTIDRIAVNGNYEPENCRWADKITQMNNRRGNVLLSFNGKTLSVAQWVRDTGLPRTTILGRLGRKWSVEKTLMTPLMRDANRT